MRTTTYLLLGLALLIAVPACGEPSDELKNVGDGLGDAWDAVKVYGVKKRGEAEIWISKQVARFPAKLEAAKAKAATAGDDTSKALDDAWKATHEKYEAMMRVSADGWEKARDEFVQAWANLQKQIDGGS